MAPRKQNVEPLDRQRIVEAAMAIIDDEGLEALSMRRLGAALGVNPMAAYYHVPNKAALYDLVLDAVMASVDASAVRPECPLPERLKQAARAYRTAILAHPRAIPVLASRSLRTATALRPVEPFLGVLFEAGLTATEVLAAVDCIAQYILGVCVGYYHHTVDDETSGEREFEELDAAEFPNVSRMLAEGRYAGSEAEFEFGLDAIVRGLLGGPRLALEVTS
ncbi:MAG TPA: TetR/AcrR family transcriptional regulator C-terminal domain-containing protein [Thermoleophilia bacterium]|nr:TetR/AcrR family transcriptional regulator C-terminal domain-containing protein [Thermoleophilia bacterium]